MLTWVKRLIKLCSLANISLEPVKFDLQQMEHPEIQGVEYQQGQCAGYEVREYLLEKWNRACSYCGVQHVPLQVEHIQAKANRVSNLCLACDSCNRAKGTQDICVFLAQKPALLARVLAQAKAPLKDTVAVNSLRLAVYGQFTALGLPTECGSSGLTKYNLVTRGLPKMHWIDAACVGKSTPSILDGSGVVPLRISATGHGSRQMCRMNRFGFPRTGPKQQKRVRGFQTGDVVRAVVTKGIKLGTYVGEVAVRTPASFNITTKLGIVQEISHQFCRLIARSDGYSYSQRKERAFPPAA